MHSALTPLQQLFLRLRTLTSTSPAPSVPRNFFTPTTLPLVLTDGSYLPRPLHLAGIGCYFGPSHPLNHSAPLHTARPSSIAAEVHAATTGLRLLILQYPDEKMYCVLSDNQPVVNVLNDGIDGEVGWGKHQGWLEKRGLGEVARELRGLVAGVRGRGGVVRGVKVARGGVGGAHRLAKRGAMMLAAAGVEVRDAAGDRCESKEPRDLAELENSQTHTYEEDEPCVHVRSLREIIEEEARAGEKTGSRLENIGAAI